MGATAREWMSKALYTVSRTASATELAGIFSTRRVTSVPVIEHGRVVGVVSRSDLASSLAKDHSMAESMFDDLLTAEGETSDERSEQLGEFVGRRLQGKRVEQLMTANPITVTADQDMRSVAQCLVENKIHHAPVLDGEKLVGVISTFDIARWVAS